MTAWGVYVPCKSETQDKFGSYWMCTDQVGHEGQHRAYWNAGVAQLTWGDTE